MLLVDGQELSAHFTRFEFQCILCMNFEPPWTGGNVYLTRLCMVDAGRERYHHEISGSGWSITRDNFWADHEFGEHFKIPVRQCTLIFYFFNCCCCKVWFLKLYYDLLYKGSNWSGLWRIQFFLILVPNLIKVWSSMLILSIFLSIGFCSFRWDILTGNLELVEQIDGHTDVVYGSFDPKYYKRFVFFQQAFYYSQIYRILMYFSISECRHHSSSLFYWANQPHCWAYLLIPFILYTSLYIFLKVLDNGIHL